MSAPLVNPIEDLDDGSVRIYESIPERRQRAINNEKKLLKFTIQLKEEGYTQIQINDVFNNHLTPELMLDVVNKYDRTHDKEPEFTF